mmetsp:Transcript_23178/g.41005  ORF Transcript_23178/g.41005 Transcript_23178/m.41005 type:complete len:258 (+) Transcript_23178:140-913(+)|eukprot:CAMPEP_0197515154 /NCGR_PEP_ID=MMETSP1318-20131121/366_1 /TAXON_ID=552666 /ORGANISM="Partenskyella glossopodia, Strain RCC365" /LENGTH=257 /DNA_ID=CAMNT_0043063441 /DNA_START=71 /DNA_END=844 /DNA_ORIENTATION=+
MGCGRSRQRTSTPGGKVCKKLIVAGHGDATSLINDANFLTEITQVMYPLLMGDTKPAQMYQKKHESNQLKKQASIVEQIWDFHVKRFYKKAPEELKNNRTLPKYLAKQVMKDFTDGSYDCAVEFEHKLFDAIWSPMVPMLIAQGTSQAFIREKRKKVLKAIESKTQTIFESTLTWKVEAIDKFVHDLKSTEVKVPPKDDKSEEQLFNMVAWEDFSAVYTSHPMFKALDPNLLLMSLTPKIQETIQWKLCHATGKNRA